MKFKDFIKKFYCFNKILTPSIIYFIFGFFVIISIILGMNDIIDSFGYTYNIEIGLLYKRGNFLLFLLGTIKIIIGTILSKVFCELILIFFENRKHLKKISKNIDKILKKNKKLYLEKNIINKKDTENI